jgi:hypothetical protein
LNGSLMMDLSTSKQEDGAVFHSPCLVSAVALLFYLTIECACFELASRRCSSQVRSVGDQAGHPHQQRGADNSSTSLYHGRRQAQCWQGRRRTSPRGNRQPCSCHWRPVCYNPHQVPLSTATHETNHAPNRSVKVTTVAPHSQTLQGTLFTACPKFNIIAINTAPAPPNPSSTLSNQPGDYHIIPIQHISSFDIVSLDSNAAKQTITTVQPPIAPVDIKKLREREEAKIRQLREQEANKGKGVSREAQQIFDALKRLYGTTFLSTMHKLMHTKQAPYPLARTGDCRQRCGDY